MAICQTRKRSLKLMLTQQKQLQAPCNNYPDLFFVRLEASEVSIKCRKCAEQSPTDDSLRWATDRKTYFYMKLVRYSLKTSNGAQRFGVPVDPDISNSVPTLGLACNYCRPKPDRQLWIYGHSWHKPRTLTMLWRAGASDARNARELLEEETGTLISFQGGPVE